MSPAAAKALTRVAVSMGQTVRNERIRRRWSLQTVADRAGLSAGHLQELESGVPASLETYCRVATALELWPELLASDPRQRQRAPGHDQDFVHAAMGELQASRLRSNGFGVGMDEPYQHYQFAGRADLVAWESERAALLHIENRTGFPKRPGGPRELLRETQLSRRCPRTAPPDRRRALAQRQPRHRCLVVGRGPPCVEAPHRDLPCHVPGPVNGLSWLVGWSRSGAPRRDEFAGPVRSLAGRPRATPLRHPGRCTRSPTSIS